MKRILALCLLLTLLLGLFSVNAAETEEITVYLNGTLGSSGDGLTPETAVNTIADAYARLSESAAFMNDAAARGRIIVCGDTAQRDSFLPDTDFRHKGRLTVAAINGAVLHLGRENELKRIYFQFCGPTCLDNMTLDLCNPASGSAVTLYAGTDLTTTESFAVTRAGLPLCMGDVDCYFSVRGGYRDKKATAKTVSMKLLGGVFRSVSAGSERHAVGDVEITVGGEVKITRFIECGSVNSQPIGDVTVNIEKGQQLEKLFLYSYLLKDTDAVQGSLTLNIHGIVSELLPQRNDAAGTATAIRQGDITVNLFSDGAVTALGSDYSLNTKACCTTGDVILNLCGYDGRVLQRLEEYDCINLFGTETVTSGKTNDGVNIYGYCGAMSLGTYTPDVLRLFDSADVLYTGTLNAEATVEAGSTLRLLEPLNQGRVEQEGVVLVLPPMSDAAPVLQVDFEDGTCGALAEVCGSPTFVDGYDGGTALYIRNVFGEPAQNYVVFHDLQGIDLRQDDYTVIFRYKTVNGGTYHWTGSDKTSLGGTSVTETVAGGVLLTNGVVDGEEECIVFSQLPQTCYLTAETTDTFITGIYQVQDDLWHQVAFVVDRECACSIYVDAELVGSMDLSQFSGMPLGANGLVLGADLLGQYGLGSAYIDDLQLYPQALSAADICYHAAFTSAQCLTQEINRRLAADEPHLAVDITSLRENNQKLAARLQTVQPTEYASLLAETAALEDCYSRYLSDSIEGAAFGLALLSDIHICTEGDACAVNLETVFSALKQGPAIDGVLIAGDFAETSTADAVHNAFATLNGMTPAQWQIFAGYGNHEVRYISEEECYKAGAVQFWEELQPHISSDEAVRRFGAATLDSTYHYCYGMTYKGYHVLVLNADDPGQTGDAERTGDPSKDPLRYGVYFENGTLRWLERMLTIYEQDGRPILVVGHFPFDGSVIFPTRDVRAIGSQDAEVRRILGAYDNVIYVSGHMHLGLGIANPVTVHSSDGGSFTQINLPSLKASPRGLMGTLAGWYLFAFEDRIELRTRDFSNGQWLPEYDVTIRLTASADCTGGEDCPAGSFTDVSGWYHEAVDSAVRMGCIAGMTETTFGPNVALNRAMLVTILYRAAGSPQVSGGCSFTDVKASDYFYNAVCWAQENQIVYGVSDTKFDPNGTATREMIAAILYRIAGSPATEWKSEFADSDQISSYARNAVAWATGEGLFSGYPDHTLRPKRTITRAELVTLVVKGLYLFV